ncbi:MAG: DUF6265 family protein [Myxococcota bacterium]
MWMWWTAALASGAPDWLDGCWVAQEAGCRETWLVADGVAAGAGLCTGEGGVTWEHVWLGPIDGTLTYVATPSGQARTEFPAVEQTADRVRFENPEHDFPQRITYVRKRAGMEATVEAGEGATARGFVLDFRPCGAASPKTGKRARRSP